MIRSAVAGDGQPDAAGPGGPEHGGAYAVLGEEVGLTPRRGAILRLLTLGLSNQEIADECFLSINSVESYIRSAYRRIGVTSRSQAVVWCIQHGFEPPTEETASNLPPIRPTASRGPDRGDRQHRQADQDVEHLPGPRPGEQRTEQAAPYPSPANHPMLARHAPTANHQRPAGPWRAASEPSSSTVSRYTCGFRKVSALARTAAPLRVSGCTRRLATRRMRARTAT